MSLDVDDLADWVPLRENWVLGLRILAGPADGPGEESFDLTVCNVGWLAELSRRGHRRPSSLGRRVFRLAGPARTRRAVRGAVRGSDMAEVAEKLARLGYWEFEDYQA